MDKDLENKIKIRQNCNRQITDIISNFVDNNPDLRFHQILQILNINKMGSNGTIDDKFYEESVDTLNNIKIENS